MTFVGSIDFKNGDFNLRHFEARNIIEASRLQKEHVKVNYASVIDQITLISVNDMRYIQRMLNEY